MDDALDQSLAGAEEAAALTARLVSFRSYPGEEGDVQRAVAAWLDDNGIAAELRETVRDRPNVVARIENGPGPTMLFNGHTDTVLAADGWSCDPWRGKREGDRLYGLGACDMKSGVAAAMLATRALDRNRELWRGTLVFSAVVDEEAFSIGARALIAEGPRADYCIVTESSREPCLGSVGKVLVRMDVTGKATHASWPDAGVNAAIEAAKLVAGLDEIPLVEHPRFEATRAVLSFHSGNDQYVITVPERARVLINRMIVPGETAETILADLRALADRLDSPAVFAFVVDPPYYPPWEIEPDHALVGALRRAFEREHERPPIWTYTGFGDANLFSGEAGIPTIQVGATGSRFHEADEWVSVTSIVRAARLLVRVTAEMLPAS
ncbi:MAG: M20/M25/M40 family metallo-hydrolase [Chloroflexota bacterium]|nr:M20/M25/M40 family metallo-hydrolase [Chloroflexota bacterium]